MKRDRRRLLLYQEERQRTFSEKRESIVTIRNKRKFKQINRCMNETKATLSVHVTSGPYFTQIEALLSEIKLIKCLKELLQARRKAKQCI